MKPGVQSLSIYCAFFLLLMLYFLSAMAAGAAPRRLIPTPEQYVIQFRRQLHFSDDLNLRQNTDTASVNFKCASSCQPLAGSALHLFLQHSAGLDRGRSFLTVSLNYGVLRSLQLDENTEKPAEMVVPLPAGQLKPENELVIAVEQYPAKASANSDVWTLIGARSFIAVQCEKHPSRLDLRFLPAPLVDPYSYGSKRLALLLPEHPSSATLEATALLVANLSAWVAPDPLSIEVVSSLKASRSPLLIVGTPWEQPQLASLQGRAPFVLYQRKGETRIAPVHGTNLADGEGAVCLSTVPDEDMNVALCVVGNSPGAVLRAARALRNRDPAISGNIARVPTDPAAHAHRQRQWKGFMPPANRFTLADLGFKEELLNSQNGFSAVLPIDAPPDASFLGYGHQMFLVLKTHTLPSARGGWLNVSFNNALIGKLDMGKVPSGHASVRIQIPARLLKIGNALKISMNGPPGGGQLPEVSLMPDTSFFLPRDYSADLPDLSLLRHKFYPFSLMPDLSDTLILVPNDIDRDTYGMIMEFANFLGREVPTDHFDFRMRQKAGLTETEISSSNLINFQIEPAYPPKRIPARTRGAARAEVPSGAPNVREIVSPGNSTKCVLTIAAGSPRALARLSHALFFEGALDKLTGDTAYWTQHEIVCLNRAARRRMRTIFYLADLEIWLRVNWIVLPLILTGASGILFVGMRLMLDRYKRGR